MATKSKKAPVQFRGQPMQKDNLQNFMEEWSLSQAEANHVETIEEANDFNIEDEDEGFFGGLTVYEMHDQAEENLALFQQAQINDPPPESNETDDRARENLTHDQSAPVEPNSGESQTNPADMLSPTGSPSPQLPEG